MIVAQLILMLITVQDSVPSYLILEGGKVLRIEGEAHFEGSYVYFTLPQGERSMLPADLVDQAATKAYNEEQAAKRASEQESSQAATASSQAAEPPEISISGSYSIPDYDKTQNVTTTLDGQSVQAADEDEGLIEPPKIHSWPNSSEGIYVLREEVRRYSDGYEIRTQVAVNDASGYRNINLEANLYFEDGSKESVNVSVTPNSLSRGEEGIAMIRVDSQQNLRQTQYTVSAVTGTQPSAAARQ